MSDSRLTYLFGKYFDKTATPEERVEFMQHVVSLKSDDPLFTLMERAYQSDHSLIEDFTPDTREKILKNVFISGSDNLNPNIKVLKPKFYNFSWIKYAAAVLLVAFGIGLFMYKNNHPDLLAYSNQDILPAGHKATLTLDNGQKILLEVAPNGILASQGNISISKTASGQLIYNVKGNETGVPVINKIETPMGGQYQVNLPDGTRVWLNAASTLEFPTQFTGTDRKVRLIGEAYFEVSKDATKPFKVEMNKELEVLVLGTHFNINAYDGEKTINTTLLEGSVMVNSSKGSKKIAPGQQIQFSNESGNLSLLKEVDVNQAIAWKNGFFSTESISLQDLMSEVSRWYDVKVIYKDPVQADFVAKIPRNVSLQELLRLLELTKQVNFKLENKTLIVMK